MAARIRLVTCRKTGYYYSGLNSLRSLAAPGIRTGCKCNLRGMQRLQAIGPTQLVKQSDCCKELFQNLAGAITID